MAITAACSNNKKSEQAKVAHVRWRNLPAGTYQKTGVSRGIAREYEQATSKASESRTCGKTSKTQHGKTEGQKKLVEGTARIHDADVGTPAIVIVPRTHCTRAARARNSAG